MIFVVEKDMYKFELVENFYFFKYIWVESINFVGLGIVLMIMLIM